MRIWGMKLWEEKVLEKLGVLPLDPVKTTGFHDKRVAINNLGSGSHSASSQPLTLGQANSGPSTRIHVYVLEKGQLSL